MSGFDALLALHPALQITALAALLVNGLLIFQLRRRWVAYSTARHWPRLTVKADSVKLMRVVHSQANSLQQAEYHEAVFDFRYRLGSREYSKQSVKQVSSAEEAESLRQSATLSFLYNPDAPEQTLDSPPGPAPVVVTLIGLVIANGMLLGLADHLSTFLNGDAP